METKAILDPVQLEQVSNDNLGFTRQIVAIDEDGSKIVLVDLYATITNNTANQSINYNLNVVNPVLVEAHQKAVQAEVDKFVADIKEKTVGMCLVTI